MFHSVNSFIDNVNKMNYRVAGDNHAYADKLLHESKSCDEYYGKVNTWYVDQQEKNDLMEKQNGGS